MRQLAHLPAVITLSDVGDWMFRPVYAVTVLAIGVACWTHLAFADVTSIWEVYTVLAAAVAAAVLAVGALVRGGKKWIMLAMSTIAAVMIVKMILELVFVYVTSGVR